MFIISHSLIKLKIDCLISEKDNYIQGWVAGFLNNPELEEQRITDEWESGYEDGKEQTDENFANFC